MITTKYEVNYDHMGAILVQILCILYAKIQYHVSWFKRGFIFFLCIYATLHIIPNTRLKRLRAENVNFSAALQDKLLIFYEESSIQ